MASARTHVVAAITRLETPPQSISSLHPGWRSGQMLMEQQQVGASDCTRSTLRVPRRFRHDNTVAVGRSRGYSTARQTALNGHRTVYVPCEVAVELQHVDILPGRETRTALSLTSAILQRTHFRRKQKDVRYDLDRERWNNPAPSCRGQISRRKKYFGDRRIPPNEWSENYEQYVSHHQKTAVNDYTIAVLPQTLLSIIF